MKLMPCCIKLVVALEKCDLEKLREYTMVGIWKLRPVSTLNC